MPRRAVSLAILLLLIGILLAAPAQAKCCPLEHLIISGSGYDEPVRISAHALEDQLGPLEQGNLYWPFFNASVKGDERPKGKLGPAYDITYILENVDGEPIEAREVVYLEADPPVGFTPASQTQDWDPDDGEIYPIDSGWRPFPLEAANALLLMLNNPQVVSLEGDVVTGTTRSWLAPLVMATAVILLVGSIWFFLRRRRRTARPVTP